VLDLGDFVLVRRGDKIVIVNLLGVPESGEYPIDDVRTAVAKLVGENY